MIYQIQRVTDSGNGENWYTTSETRAAEIASVQKDRHPDDTIRARVIVHPTQDQIYQAAQTDENWGIRG